MIDQIGGPRRRAFGRKRVLEVISAHRADGLAGQQRALLAAFAANQGQERRRDDVTALGLRPLADGLSRPRAGGTLSAQPKSGKPQQQRARSA